MGFLVASSHQRHRSVGASFFLFALLSVVLMSLSSQVTAFVVAPSSPLLVVPIRSHHHHGGVASSSSSSTTTTTTALAAAASKPFGVVVKATIDPDRMGEFLTMIENNAKNSRNEPGCLRFDVLRDQESPNQFIFYEVYKTSADVDYHKTQDHYNAWATFKENGGVLESISYKVDGEFMT